MQRSTYSKSASFRQPKERAASLSEVPKFQIPPTRSPHLSPKYPVGRSERSKSVCASNLTVPPQTATHTHNPRKNSVISFGETISSWLSIPNKVKIALTLHNLGQQRAKMLIS